ncbi:type IV pilus assembly protein PilB [Acinetobacter calcoaceticus]|uniref:Type IV pilus assembly protein PilB n=1 Tax=Acinetobacter calcoaceticus TaxID=471 RepID=A0A4R1Y5Q2_ACICA|nr:type IV pilus assembly protein PilB [Acinetobacter calcoaceticus]
MSSQPHLAIFSGFIRRLVDEHYLSSAEMQQALLQAQKNQCDIIAYLLLHFPITARTLAEMIAIEFGEPFFDLDAYDPAHLPRGLVSDALLHQYQVLPLRQRGKTLALAMSDPTNFAALDAIRFNSNLSIEPIIVEYDKLTRMLKQHFPQDDGFSSGVEELSLDLMTEFTLPEAEPLNAKVEEEAPIVKYINKLLLEAIRMGASDLHFEPYERSYRVRYRIDGVLREIIQPPIQLASRLAARLKVMSQMDISEKRLPQDGRIKFRISKTVAIDFRVNSLPTLFGEKIVLRILDASSARLGIDALGYEPDQKALFLEALHKPQGMLLITGPTGSGKTVSLYTGLNILNTESANISTAEDPVEINLEGINQVNVNHKVGLSFSVALKSFLRQDPDIIMVGEIRDLETAEIAIKAAQTGHMLMSTLHTNSAAETLSRLRNMGVSTFNLATSVNLVIAQRLARRLCPHCKACLEVPAQSLLEMGFSPHDLAQPHFKIYQAVGCSECRDGYKGRVGIYEVMKVTPEISKIIMQDGNALQIAAAAERLGFHNLRRSGLNKVMLGLTSLQEINRITTE